MTDRRQREKQEYEIEDAREWAKKVDSGGKSYLDIPNGVPVFSIKKAGNYHLDFLPYRVGKGNPDAAEGKIYWQRTFWIHRNVGASGAGICCPKKCASKRCRICDDVDRRIAEIDPRLDGADLKKARQKVNEDAPKMRQIFNLVNRAEEEKGVQIWEQGYYKNFGAALKNKLDNMEEGDDFGLFFHPTKGKTIRIMATEESGGSFNWYCSASFDFRPRPSDDYDWNVLERTYNLDAMIKVPTEEQLVRAYLQIPDDQPLPEPTGKAFSFPGRGGVPPANGGHAPAGRAPAKDVTEDFPPAHNATAGHPLGKQPTAQDLGIELESIVYYKGLECEVVKVSKDGTLLMLLDDDGEKYPSIPPSEVMVRTEKQVTPVKSAPAADEQEGEDDDPPPVAPAKRQTAPAEQDDDDDIPPPRKGRGK